MNIKRAKNAIEVSGDIIFEHVSEGHKRLNKDIKSLDFSKPVTLDLAGVRDVDSSGLQLLLAFFQALGSHECVVNVVSISDALLDSIDLAGLKRQFKL